MSVMSIHCWSVERVPVRLRTVLGAGAAAAASVFLALTPATAPASAASTTPSCGSGYSYLDSYQMYDDSGAAGGGIMYLYYNSATGYDCAYTKATEWVGTAKYMDAYIASGSSGDADPGKYAYYAGPVKVHAPHECVNVIGYVYPPSAAGPSAPGAYSTRNIGVHCA